MGGLRVLLSLGAHSLWAVDPQVSDGWERVPEHLGFLLG